MLDTNIASDVIRGTRRAVLERLTAEPLEAITVSCVTEAELRYGVAKRGYPDGLVRRVGAFLERATVLAWSSDVAAVYGALRTSIESDGLSLAPLDMMIAAHAKTVHATLVTRDRAFARLGERLHVETW